MQRTIVESFERAANAIVDGDAQGLAELLARAPVLVHARSVREHRATLLHYTAANGVEDWRQRTPANIVRIAKLLLDAGADVDAEAQAYGGACTTLGLAATSAHPRVAGVQIELLELLLDHGAVVDQPGIAGGKHSMLVACLGNGCPEAAAFLASRGATMSRAAAAGIGRLDLVHSLDGDRDLALRFAAVYGHVDVVAWLLDSGADIAGVDGHGQTAAHFAGIAGKLDVMKLLVSRNAPLEMQNSYGGTVLGQTLWSAAHGGNFDVYAALVETLIDAGAHLAPKHTAVNARIDALLAKHGSVVDPSMHWFGEGPSARSPGLKKTTRRRSSTKRKI